MKIRIIKLVALVVSLAASVGAIQAAKAQQAGYSLTVNVPSHPFGHSSVIIWLTTENEYRDNQRVSTAGGPSWTFNIPANQGNSVEVCVSAGMCFSWHLVSEQLPDVYSNW